MLNNQKRVRRTKSRFSLITPRCTRPCTLAWAQQKAPARRPSLAAAAGGGPTVVSGGRSEPRVARKKLLDAGVDLFGGELSTEPVISLVQSDQVPESQFDISVRRLLRQKFQLGLFENPVVDTAEAGQIVGQSAFAAAGAASQRQAMTLLQNNSKALSLQAGKWKIYVKNLGPQVAAGYGTVVGRARPGDKLPFELPSSMEAVCQQKEDEPYNSKAPLYKFDFGLRY